MGRGSRGLHRSNWVHVAPEMLRGPIPTPGVQRHAAAMLSGRTNGAAADELLVGVTELERGGHGGGVESLPSDVEALIEALRAAGGALDASGSRVATAPHTLDHSVCRRYQRAAAMWPADPPPSHERFAAALAHLHDAAAATQLAARRCDEARQAVEALFRSSQQAGVS